MTEHLREYGSETPFRIGLLGRKSTKNRTRFYTYIGRDALEVWRGYFDWIRGYKSGELLLVDRYGGFYAKYALRMYHLRLLERLHCIRRRGGTSKRYGYNLHEFRDVARILLHKSKAEGLDMECVEFWMSHVTDPNHCGKFYLDEGVCPEELSDS